VAAADRQIDEFVANGECEFVSEFANPFRCSSSRICSVPELI
jgi:hypothetical protein